MKKHKSCFLLSAVLFLLFNSTSIATLVHFRMDVTDTDILVGETTTLNLYAYAQSAGSGEGIVGWGFDLLLDSSEDNIVKFSSASFEHVYDVASASFPDDPYSGMVNLGTIDLKAQDRPSQIGVGLGTPDDLYDLDNYTLLAKVIVQGIAEGTVTYEMGGIFYSYLEYELEPTEVFRSDFSSVQINVIPEPATILLLGTASLILRKRRDNR